MEDITLPEKVDIIVSEWMVSSARQVYKSEVRLFADPSAAAHRATSYFTSACSTRSSRLAIVSSNRQV